MRYTRISEGVLDWDKDYIRQIMNPTFTNAEQLQTVKKALHTVITEELTDRQRQIITLHYFDGLNDSQIARKLHVQPSTVMRTRKRAEYNIYRTLRFFFDSRSQRRKE